MISGFGELRGFTSWLLGLGPGLPPALHTNFVPLDGSLGSPHPANGRDALLETFDGHIQVSEFFELCLDL